MPEATQPVSETPEGLPTLPLSTSLQPVPASKPTQLRPFLKHLGPVFKHFPWPGKPFLTQDHTQILLLSGASLATLPSALPPTAQEEHPRPALCPEHHATNPRQSKHGSGAGATLPPAPSMVTGLPHSTSTAQGLQLSEITFVLPQVSKERNNPPL